MSFSEYYEYYLTLHQNLWCRRLHVLGQIATIIYVTLSLKINLFMLFFAPFVIYPFAWSGHYFFEKNKPAAFKDPLRAKISDWLMFRDWILGRLER